MRTVALALACLLAAAGPARAALDEKAALRASQAVIGQEIGDHRLHDAEGGVVRLSDLRGKPLVVNFVYTGCFQICPGTTKALAGAVAAAERALGPGTFNVATIGFNLPFDTPEAMKDFARKQGVASRHWKFLSPEAGTLPQLLAGFGFSFEPTAAGFDHVLQASIVDAQGRVYRQLYGESFDPQKFVGPLLELAQGAPRSNSTLTDWVEEFKLLCTVYDAASGRYRVNYAVVVQLLVGASVMLFGIGVVVLEWRKRRRMGPRAQG